VIKWGKYKNNCTIIIFTNTSQRWWNNIWCRKIKYIYICI